MKKKYSLKGKKNFSEVFNKGKRYGGTGIQLIVLKDINSSGIPCSLSDEKIAHPKFGFVVGRHFGKAYSRNKFRRRMRSIFQSFLPEIYNNVRVIVRLFKDLKQLSYHDLENEVYFLLKKAEVLKKKSNL